MKKTIILLLILSSFCIGRIRIGYIVTQNAAAHMSNVYNWVVSANAALNQSYVNSGFQTNDNNCSAVIGYVRIVNYNDASFDYPTMLNHLDGTNDGYFDFIHNDKTSYYLDVIVLVSNNTAACGRAYAIAPNPSDAWVVTYWGCDNAPSYSNIGHEIGHIIGARHAINQDNANTVINGATYTYVHGICNTTNNFADIMTGNYTSCPSTSIRQNFYSDPNATYNGAPRGNTTQANVVRLFNEQFNRIGSAYSIPTSNTFNNSSVLNGDFNDIVATDYINSVNSSVNSGGRTNLRATKTITLSPPFTAVQGSELRIVTSSTEILGKQLSQNNRTEPEPVAKQPQMHDDKLLLTYSHENIFINWYYNSITVDNFSIEFTDLNGRTVLKRDNLPSVSQLSIPLNCFQHKVYVLRIANGTRILNTKLITL